MEQLTQSTISSRASSLLVFHLFSTKVCDIFSTQPHFHESSISHFPRQPVSIYFLVKDLLCEQLYRFPVTFINFVCCPIYHILIITVYTDVVCLNVLSVSHHVDWTDDLARSSYTSSLDTCFLSPKKQNFNFFQRQVLCISDLCG